MGRTATAVAEALSRAHAVLRDDLQKLEEAVRPASEERLATLRARLGATQAHITEHFRIEEENGYLDTVRSREPRLERVLGQLVEEHRQLTQSLDALVDQVATATNLDETIRGAIRGWVERVRQHEVRENDLVQNVFTLDISAED